MQPLKVNKWHDIVDDFLKLIQNFQLQEHTLLRWKLLRCSLRGFCSSSVRWPTSRASATTKRRFSDDSCMRQENYHKLHDFKHNAVLLTHWPLRGRVLIWMWNFATYWNEWYLEHSSEIALRWMAQDFADDKSTWIQVMAWCRPAPSHYLDQCWPSYMSPYDITRSQ